MRAFLISSFDIGSTRYPEFQPAGHRCAKPPISDASRLRIVCNASLCMKSLPTSSAVCGAGGPTGAPLPAKGFLAEASGALSSWSSTLSFLLWLVASLPLLEGLCLPAARTLPRTPTCAVPATRRSPFGFSGALGSGIFVPSALRAGALCEDFDDWRDVAMSSPAVSVTSSSLPGMSVSASLFSLTVLSVRGVLRAARFARDALCAAALCAATAWAQAAAARGFENVGESYATRPSKNGCIWALKR
mmetsp:Transcript_10768/g.20073  ORF Transcript_10768/g.20073 Transcript_10768/m.20073 type:complete len:246 (-) Transcript_10768:3486-4223(-)